MANISYNQEDIQNFSTMLFSHDFSRYKNFLNPDEKISISGDIFNFMIERLTVSSTSQFLSFQDFWWWTKKNHGEDLALHFCTTYHSSNVSGVLFPMLANPFHKEWKILEGAIYRLWHHYLIQAQLTYAVLRGIYKTQKTWTVISHEAIRFSSIDMLLLTQEYAIPLHINKNNSVFSLSEDDKKRISHCIRYEDKQLVEPVQIIYNPSEQSSYLLQKNGFTFFEGEKTLNYIENIFHSTLTD